MSCFKIARMQIVLNLLIIFGIYFLILPKHIHAQINFDDVSVYTNTKTLTKQSKILSNRVFIEISHYLQNLRNIHGTFVQYDGKDYKEGTFQIGSKKSIRWNYGKELSLIYNNGFVRYQDHHLNQSMYDSDQYGLSAIFGIFDPNRITIEKFIYNKDHAILFVKNISRQDRVRIEFIRKKNSRGDNLLLDKFAFHYAENNMTLIMDLTIQNYNRSFPDEWFVARYKKKY